MPAAAIIIGCSGTSSRLLLDWLRDRVPGGSRAAPSPTRPRSWNATIARLAGLGWIGKNTMLINRRLGSFTFLGALLIDVELAYDAPHEANHCGTCTRCLDACPTEAFPARISSTPAAASATGPSSTAACSPMTRRPELDGWVFGCDICQDVCPWNRKAPPGRQPSSTPRPEWIDPDLLEWLTRRSRRMESQAQGDRADACQARRAAAECRARARHPAAGRGRRAPGRAARRSREDPVVRAAAAWALGRIGTEPAHGGPRAPPRRSRSTRPRCGRRVLAASDRRRSEREKAGGIERPARPGRRFRTRPDASIAGRRQLDVGADQVVGGE